MKQRFRSGGLAAWSVNHPVGVSMIALALFVVGLFALGKLGVNLLPHIIYPEVRVRIADPGVPAVIMEDQITRQLEEQLAITEDAISVQSRTSEGASSVDLSFPYGKDIDIALRDASTRLDRAKRFLPGTIDPPVIYKRDPSQIPVTEMVISSQLMDTVALRSWADYSFSKWFLNLPGVAAVEVGGGLAREIQIFPDERRLQALGLNLDDVIDALQQENQDKPVGRLRMPAREVATRLHGRVADARELGAIHLPTADGQSVRLEQVAQIIDTHEDETLRIRLNGEPGIKLSIQKQPSANSVEVVDAVRAQLIWLQEQRLLPPDIRVELVNDQAIYVRNALRNATYAVLSGALLAMLVVYLFLGDARRTLIIGSAIPLALTVTFFLMYLGGLTLNIMTLGGLALGVGMLVDSAIVMLENIARHQRFDDPEQAAVRAAQEVNSAIAASTSTNLAAILPFLFIGGLIGLLFRELIFTIAAAMLAAMLAALTVVPAWAGRVPPRPEPTRPGLLHRPAQALLGWYLRGLHVSLRFAWPVVALFIIGLSFSLPPLLNAKQTFLPDMDEGRVQVSLTADPGISLDVMDDMVDKVEQVLLARPETDSVFSQIGGFVFGRSQREATNRSSLTVQLRLERAISTAAWIKQVKQALDELQLVGVKIHLRSRGVRGIRLSSGDDDLSLRIQGEDLEKLAELADQVVARLADLPGLSNLQHSSEEVSQEISVRIDRQRAADRGLSIETIGRTLNTQLTGRVVGNLLDGDRQIDIRLRLSRQTLQSPERLRDLLLYPASGGPVRLAEVASIQWEPVPAQILRDRQRRMVEITASLAEGAVLGEMLQQVQQRLQGFELPAGYILYDGGAAKTLQEGKDTSMILLGLAIFLVFVVMAVQYESLRNPLIILFSVPFSLIGVGLAVYHLELPLSMPVWLGVIMLAGMVVNNTIVLVESIEIRRESGDTLEQAIVNAARLRLRPVFMTTLTTVVGLLPLALGWGEGAEMLQPLAITIVFGLGFSVLVSLWLAPVAYRLGARRKNA